MVVRLEGDEFLVFVPGATLERLQLLEAVYQERCPDGPIRFLGGYAIGRPSESVVDTINRTDMKLYDRRRRDRGWGPAPPGHPFNGRRRTCSTLRPHVTKADRSQLPGIVEDGATRISMPAPCEQPFHIRMVSSIAGTH